MKLILTLCTTLKYMTLETEVNSTSLMICNDPYFYGSKHRKTVFIRSIVLLNRLKLESSSSLSRVEDESSGSLSRGAT